MSYEQSNATDSPERSFRLWIHSAWRVTLAASGASVTGAFVLAATLGAAHSVTRREASGEWISWGPLHIDHPDSTVLILLLAALLLTMASVIQSLLRSVDAVVVRHRLRQFSERHKEHKALTTRTLMAERYLLEGWARLVSSTVQALAYSALLVVIAGPSQILGLLGVLVICTVIGVSYFHTARSASEDFLAAQERANKADRESRRDKRQSSKEIMQIVMQEVSEAVYRRDTLAFRLSATKMALLSSGIVVSVLIPAFLQLSDQTLSLFLITLFIWRNRVIEAVSTIGHFAWTLCLWHNAGSAIDMTADGASESADDLGFD